MTTQIIQQLIVAADKNLRGQEYKAFYLHLIKIYEQSAMTLEMYQTQLLRWFVQCKDIVCEGDTGYEHLLAPLLSLVLSKSLCKNVHLNVLERLLQIHQDLASQTAFVLLNERVAFCFLEHGKTLKQHGNSVLGQEYIDAAKLISPVALVLERGGHGTPIRKEQGSAPAVLIPVYRRKINEYEHISLTQCRRVLSQHDIIFVGPASLRMDEYIRCIPEASVVTFSDEWFRSIASYNRLMISPLFYEKFLSFSHVLIYQLDAFVFEDKLQFYCDQGYDYLGAVWFDGRRVPVQGAKTPTITCYVGNGGFSLRHVNHSLRMLEMLGEKVKKWPGNEDIFWSFCGAAYPEHFKVAPVDIAEQFSFESIPRQSFAKQGHLPFGCHAWEKYDIDFFREVFSKYGYHI